MKIKYRTVAPPKGLPDTYVMLGMYINESLFPLTVFPVTRVWWDMFKRAEIIFEEEYASHPQQFTDDDFVWHNAAGECPCEDGVIYRKRVKMIAEQTKEDNGSDSGKVG